jgi:hypothetical protein
MSSFAMTGRETRASASVVMACEYDWNGARELLGHDYERWEQLDSETSCGCGWINGSMDSTDPLLGPLANNGGRTSTMGLKSSPAIDGVAFNAPNASPATDQRGIARPQGVRHDLGAFEGTLNLLYLPLIRK